MHGKFCNAIWNALLYSPEKVSNFFQQNQIPKSFVKFGVLSLQQKPSLLFSLAAQDE